MKIRLEIMLNKIFPLNPCLHLGVVFKMKRHIQTIVLYNCLVFPLQNPRIS